MLCLSCRRASPAGSVYCGGCGCTFGTRICGSGHRNRPAPGLACCTTCGSLELSEAARHVPLGWAGKLLAVLVAFGVWRWAAAHLPLLAGLLWHCALDALALLSGVTPCGLVRALDRGLSWLLALWLLGVALTALPGRGGAAGSWLRGLPLRALGLVAALARPLPRLLGRALLRLVWRPGRAGGRGGPPKEDG